MWFCKTHSLPLLLLIKFWCHLACEFYTFCFNASNIMANHNITNSAANGKTLIDLNGGRNGSYKDHIN